MNELSYYVSSKLSRPTESTGSNSFRTFLFDLLGVVDLLYDASSILLSPVGMLNLLMDCSSYGFFLKDIGRELFVGILFTDALVGL